MGDGGERGLGDAAAFVDGDVDGDGWVRARVAARVGREGVDGDGDDVHGEVDGGHHGVGSVQVSWWMRLRMKSCESSRCGL